APDVPPGPFLLVDLNNIIVFPPDARGFGTPLRTADLEDAEPLTLDGETIGYIVTQENEELRNAAEDNYEQRINRIFLAAGGGALALAVLLSVLFAQGLTRPLREITAAIRAVAGGDLGQQVPVRTQDELGHLAAAVNQMSADLAYSNQLRRQMTADIAHELRTPLTVLAGYLEALRDGVLEPRPDRLETMHAEAQHLQRLVEDLRTLSLADAGELPLERGLVDVGEVQRQVIGAFAHQAEQQGVTLEPRTPADLPPLDADRERLAQVLGNLVSNALRYTPAGGQITLGATHTSGTTTLTVQDTGRGIAPEHLPHIFERFYRADTARQTSGDANTSENGESGLGLAIVRSVVEAHGGSITADSALDQGTTFTITLPNR
ncbi:MAG: HAMP domain-containing protein, partial [Chloroflexi bacterium]|nr:HAMP domain-containing protein [Chloroflexota bacterium]